MTENLSYEDYVFQDGYTTGFIEATIDTECSLSIERGFRAGRFYWYPRLSLGMSKGDAKGFLENFKEICGGVGSEIKPERWKNKKGEYHTMWKYKIQGLSLIGILKKIKLIVKERQRLLILEFAELHYNRKYRTIDEKHAEKLNKLYERSKELNLPQKSDIKSEIDSLSLVLKAFRGETEDWKK